MPSKESIQTGVDILSFFERKYACGGICTPGLFFWSLTLDKGTPSTTQCLLGFRDEVKDNFGYLGMAAIATGFMSFLVWIF